jgi:hypothetical protein
MSREARSGIFTRENLTNASCVQLRKWCQEFHIAKAYKMKKTAMIRCLLVVTHEIPNQVSVVLSRKRKKETVVTSEKDNKKSCVSTTSCASVRAAQVIQRFYKRYIRGFINQEDFITMERFTASQYPLFLHVVNENQVYRFNPLDLVKYILDSGIFANPFTKTEFNSVELNRLTRVILTHNPSFPHHLGVDKDHLITTAKNRQHQERNTEFYREQLEQTFFMHITQLTEPRFALSMQEEHLDTMVWQFQQLIPTRNQYLYALYLVNNSAFHHFFQEWCEELLTICGCTLFTMPFRRLVYILYHNLTDTVGHFSGMSPDTQVHLLEPLMNQMDLQFM